MQRRTAFWAALAVRPTPVGRRPHNNRLPRGTCYLCGPLPLGRFGRLNLRGGRNSILSQGHFDRILIKEEVGDASGLGRARCADLPVSPHRAFKSSFFPNSLLALVTLCPARGLPVDRHAQISAPPVGILRSCRLEVRTRSNEDGKWLRSVLKFYWLTRITGESATHTACRARAALMFCSDLGR